jgi:hypothetical protein
MKRRKLMIIAAYILGTIVFIFVIGKVNLYFQFNKEVKTLFAQSKNISTKTFHYQQLEDLPAPVQCYFKHVLKEGQAYINYVRITHDGQFKTGQEKDWINISGEQYFTVQKPGFIWKGTTTMFTARDMYMADKGRLVVSLLGLINIVDGKGEAYNQGELLRWLAENVWFPTNLLPSENLHWLPIDAHTAQLTFDYQGLALFYRVRFNEIGEITQMETQRYMDEKSLETWIGKLSNYQEINGIIIPTMIEASWKLEKGEFSYAKFRVKKIQYDKAERF